jgi:hypothetical protein
MEVEDNGPSQADRSIYAGRAGLRTNPGRGPFAMFAGIGGGLAPAAGSFVAADAGLAIGYDNCVIVPVAQGAGLISRPVESRPVDVTTEDNTKTHTSTAQPTYGVMTLADREKTQTLGGFGVGIEVPL